MITLTREQADELARRAHGLRALLLADETGIAASVMLAEALQHAGITPLVLLQSTTDFTQRLRPSTIMVDGMPAGVIATLATLDQQGIAARLCHAELPGCHEGCVTELASGWLHTLTAEAREDVTLYVAGGPVLINKAGGLSASMLDVSRE